MKLSPPAVPSKALGRRTMDRLGIWLSALCAVHCALTPVLLVAAPMVGSVWADPWVHIGLAVVVAPLALWMAWKGFRHHGQARVPVLALAGVVSITASFALPCDHGHGHGEAGCGSTQCSSSSQTGSGGADDAACSSEADCSSCASECSACPETEVRTETAADTAGLVKGSLLAQANAQPSESLLAAPVAPRPSPALTPTEPAHDHGSSWWSLHTILTTIGGLLLISSHAFNLLAHRGRSCCSDHAPQAG